MSLKRYSPKELRKQQIEKLARSFDDVKQRFPFVVKIPKSSKLTLNREEVRDWFKSRNMSVYNISGDDADVAWNDKWNIFCFKSEGAAMEFAMRFL